MEAKAERDEFGRFKDANEGSPINGKYDLGHKYGEEFRKHKADAETRGLIQKEFNDLMNNPDLYQIEDPHINRSRKYEEKH
ncbi:MAG: HNH/ENDO VII family nuclease [Bacteroidales bacterium]|nr:HNH/ENDO VII family nuclease [Bacteroidales bacterium]